MDKSSDIKSILSIKVLRLLKPTMVGPLAIPIENMDLVGDLWERELESDVTVVSGINSLSLGNFLRIPQGFGNMYLGETFSSYVVVQNESTFVVKEATCKVELQTQTQKFLLANTKCTEDLNPGLTIDILMSHEIKEMGKHMLIVTLQYTPINHNVTYTEPLVIERYFKFQVKKPLDVKTKLYNAESDEVYLEAQVQNITSAPITLEKVELEPSMAFSCLKLTESTVDGIKNSKSVPGKIHDWPNKMLDVEDSFQFLYRLTPKIEDARTTITIGKLDIMWRTAFGDKGHLQTSQLQRQPPAWNELKLSIKDIPRTCSVDQPFAFTIKVGNATKHREMDLQLELLDESSNLEFSKENYCWLGITKYSLGKLAPLANIDISLSAFPLRAGLLSISNLRITELITNEKFLFNDIAQIFVSA